MEKKNTENIDTHNAIYVKFITRCHFEIRYRTLQVFIIYLSINISPCIRILNFTPPSLHAICGRETSCLHSQDSSGGQTEDRSSGIAYFVYLQLTPFHCTGTGTAGQYASTNVFFYCNNLVYGIRVHVFVLN